MSSVVGSDVRSSTHICLPFETDDEKHDATVTFIHEGLSRGARCLFTGTSDDFATLARGLEALGICTRRATARGALQCRSAEELYFPDGSFDPPRSLDIVDSLIDDAIVAGFTGLRLTAELTRIPVHDEWRKIVWYDAMINERFARRPVAHMCRYPRSLIPAARVRDLLRTHPIAIVRGEACDNPFYERPDIVLCESDDSETRLDWQFRQLRVQHRTRQQLEGMRVSAVAAAAQLAVEVQRLRAGRERSSKPD